MNQPTQEFEKHTSPTALLKLALLQAVGTLFFCLGLYYCFDTREALSGLFGGLTATTMNFFMAARLFAAHRVANIRQVPAGEALVRFYISVVLKILFTLAVMVFFIIVIKVSILPFIVAYLLIAVIVNLLYLYIEAR